MAIYLSFLVVFTLIGAILAIGQFRHKRLARFVGWSCLLSAVAWGTGTPQILEFAPQYGYVAAFDEQGKITEYDKQIVICKDRCLNYPQKWPAIKSVVSPVVVPARVAPLRRLEYEATITVVDTKKLLSRIMAVVKQERKLNLWAEWPAPLALDRSVEIYQDLVETALVSYNQRHADELVEQCWGLRIPLSALSDTMRAESQLTDALRGLGLKIRSVVKCKRIPVLVMSQPTCCSHRGMR